MSIGERVDRDNAFLVAWVQRAQVMADRGELEAPLLALPRVESRARALRARNARPSDKTTRRR